MTTKPRKQLRPNQKLKPERREEFRNCDAPNGCPNVISIRGRADGYHGPIYCVLHRDTENAK